MKRVPSNRVIALQRAVLASFFGPADRIDRSLDGFSESDWRKILYWLDISGLALYLLDHLTTLGVEGRIPKTIVNRLQTSLCNNQERTKALFDEAVEIGSILKEKGITFAFLKGFTLPPEIVADPALRCQMDIDILIRRSDAIAAEEIVRGFGYSRYCTKEAEWTFAAGTDLAMSIEDLYKVRPQKMVELHFMPPAGVGSSPLFTDRLSRSRFRTIHGVDMPVLSPEDIFVQQAVHIFKHLCSEHTRAVWLLEYWRHVRARRSDLAFWQTVRSTARREPGAELAIAIVTRLATEVFGQPAPEALLDAAQASLSREVQLWVDLYGEQVLLAHPPGNKFYLFLQQQIEPAGKTSRNQRYRSFLPLHWWPVRVTHASPESGSEHA